MTTTPPTEQRLDEITAAVATYQQHPSIGFACCTAHPVADAGAMLLAEVHRLQAALAKEELLHGDTIDDRDRAQDAADKLAYAVAPEDVIGEHTADNSPWANALDLIASKADVDRLRDRVAELEAYAYGCDAEGCVIPHSSWCDAAKKTAAENDGCTCGKPWTGHPQPHAMHCWTVNPPRAEVEEMRKRIAELTAPAPTSAPPTASHGPAGDRDSETGAEGAAGRAGDPADRIRALHFLEAANYLRDAHHRDGLTVQEIGAALRHTADQADPMVGSLHRDGLGLDEIADMLRDKPGAGAGGAE